MHHAAGMPPATLEKFVAVRRSDHVPTVYWWSLPLALPRVAELVADTLPGARLVVHPAAALGAYTRELGARTAPGGTAVLPQVRRWLELRAEGHLGACTAALFPPSVSDVDLDARLPRFRADLERLPFTLACRSTGRDQARHEFCFRVPGKVIAALEALALGRAFGGNAGQVEMALLQGLGLRPGQQAQLHLVMQDGGARLVQASASGRQRIIYLESGRGFTGVIEEQTLREALHARGRETWRRFPVGVVMFAGLPFFIAAFWTAGVLRSWLRPARAAAAPSRVPARRQPDPP